jgi:uracil permease
MTPTTPTDYDFRFRDCILGAQMLFVAFGALVLVPLLTGLDPNVALFTAGAGTLIYQVITKGRIPVFLASSFSFIAPTIYGVKTWGIPGTLCGLAAASVVYVLLAALVKVRGLSIVDRALPPIVTGPVIMVIGLILSPVAVNMALGKSGDGAIVLVPESTALTVSMISLGVTIVVSMFGKGMLRLIPILCGIIAGYATAGVMGILDFSTVTAAPWFAVPNFVAPEWNLEAILFIVPVAIAPAIEHVGGILAIGSVTGRQYVSEPGLHRSLLGDGVATAVAASLGGPPSITYAEVTGAVALIKMFNPAVMTWASITAITLAFVGKLGALLLSIPVPVMGGIMILLFGAIAVVGLNTLVRAGQDLMEPRNLAIVALVVVLGIGGMAFHIGKFTLTGIGLAGISGLVLNLVLPRPRK